MQIAILRKILAVSTKEIGFLKKFTICQDGASKTGLLRPVSTWIPKEESLEEE